MYPKMNKVKKVVFHWLIFVNIRINMQKINATNKMKPIKNKKNP